MRLCSLRRHLGHVILGCAIPLVTCAEPNTSINIQLEAKAGEDPASFGYCVRHFERGPAPVDGSLTGWQLIDQHSESSAIRLPLHAPDSGYTHRVVVAGFVAGNESETAVDPCIRVDAPDYLGALEFGNRWWEEGNERTKQTIELRMIPWRDHPQTVELANSAFYHRAPWQAAFGGGTGHMYQVMIPGEGPVVEVASKTPELFAAMSLHVVGALQADDGVWMCDQSADSLLERQPEYLGFNRGAKNLVTGPTAICLALDVHGFRTERHLVTKNEWAASLGGKLADSSHPNPHDWTTFDSVPKVAALPVVVGAQTPVENFPIAAPMSCDAASCGPGSTSHSTLGWQSTPVPNVLDVNSGWPNVIMAPLNESSVAMVSLRRVYHQGRGSPPVYASFDGETWETHITGCDPNHGCPTLNGLSGADMAYAPGSGSILLAVFEYVEDEYGLDSSQRTHIWFLDLATKRWTRETPNCQLEACPSTFTSEEYEELYFQLSYHPQLGGILLTPSNWQPRYDKARGLDPRPNPETWLWRESDRRWTMLGALPVERNMDWTSDIRVVEGSAELPPTIIQATSGTRPIQFTLEADLTWRAVQWADRFVDGTMESARFVENSGGAIDLLRAQWDESTGIRWESLRVAPGGTIVRDHSFPICEAGFTCAGESLTVPVASKASYWWLAQGTKKGENQLVRIGPGPHARPLHEFTLRHASSGLPVESIVGVSADFVGCLPGVVSSTPVGVGFRIRRTSGLSAEAMRSTEDWWPPEPAEVVPPGPLGGSPEAAPLVCQGALLQHWRQAWSDSRSLGALLASGRGELPVSMHVGLTPMHTQDFTPRALHTSYAELKIRYDLTKVASPTARMPSQPKR